MEPSDYDAYRLEGKSLVPLPNPRKSEVDELYVALEKWMNAVDFAEETYQQEVGDAGVNQREFELQSDNAEFAIPEHLFNAEKRLQERIFVSRLRLKAPIGRERHVGKYVIMTMSRANLKQIDYGVVFVAVTPSKFTYSA